jgi:hypothetical protein
VSRPVDRGRRDLQLAAVRDDDAGSGAAGFGAEGFDLFHHVHPLDHLAEDDVVAVEPKLIAPLRNFAPSPEQVDSRFQRNSVFQPRGRGIRHDVVMENDRARRGKV